jgi:hypothetical protein
MNITPVEIFISIFTIMNSVLGIFILIKFRSHTAYSSQLNKEAKNISVEEILKELRKEQDKHTQYIKILEDTVNTQDNASETFFQKIGFRRYNPFHETGGDQSFILVLLDRNNNGVVLSSLHQRDLTRVYAKLVTGGESEHKLSKEEKEVLNEAIESKRVKKVKSTTHL